MKGYVLSLVTILLFAILINFVREEVLIKKQLYGSFFETLPTEKISYIIDDVFLDLKGRELVVVNYSNTSVKDNLSISKSQFFSNYSSFLSDYSNKTNANVSLIYLDPFEIRFSNGLVYSSSLDNRIISLLNKSDTYSYISRYVVEMVAAENYTAYSEKTGFWAASGTYLEFRYKDLGHNFTKTGYFTPTKSNEIYIDYPTGRLTLTMGSYSTYRNALYMKQENSNKLSLLNVSTDISSENATWNTNLIISITNANHSSFPPAPTSATDFSSFT